MISFTAQEEREHLENIENDVIDFQRELRGEKVVEYPVGCPVEWRKRFEEKKKEKLVYGSKSLLHKVFSKV